MGQSEYWADFMRRRLSRRRLLQAGTVAGAGLWVGSALGCGSRAPSTNPSAGGSQTPVDTPQQGGTLRINLAYQEYTGVDPYVTRNFAAPVYDNLVYQTPLRDKILPGLAESWELPDDTTYIFHLQKGVKFQDVPPVNGRECTAEDAAFSVERTLTNGAQYPLQPAFSFIDKAEAVDKYTLKVTTKAPFAPLLGNMAFYADAIMPKEIVGADNVAQVAIGTGPFMFDRWDKGDKMVFKRNPTYRVPGQPYVDAVQHQWTVDYTSLDAIFISDQADLITVYFQDMPMIRSKRPKAQFQLVPALSQHTLIFRQGFKPTDDLRVRQAMDMTVQRWEMVYRVTGGTGELYGAYPTGPIDYYATDWALPLDELQKRTGYMPRDKFPKADAVAQAKKLLADAGYPDGFDLELLERPEQYEDMVVVMLQEWWKDIGIRVNIKQQDLTTFMSTLIRGDFQTALWITGNGNPDPDGQVYGALRSGSVSNYGKWSDPKLDQMLDAQRTTVDKQKRQQVVLDMQRYILDTLPRLFLYDWTTFGVLRENIRGFQAETSLTFGGWDQMNKIYFAKA